MKSDLRIGASSGCENGCAAKRLSKKTRGPKAPRSYDSPKVDDDAYFFFDDFFADFLAAAFFFAAIKLTTFHAVRDLTVAPTWQKTPDLSGQLNFACGLRQGWEGRRPSTFTGASRLFVQFVAIIVLT
jgi:hypothetical protein